MYDTFPFSSNLILLTISSYSALLFSSASSHLLSKGWSLVFLSNPYFSARAEVREIRLPSLFASSLLWRSTNSFSEKSKSSNVEPRSRLYRIVSTGYFFASSIGSTVLPRDFEIFCPLNVRYPWTRSFFGSSIPADISIAGQITEWNQLMPLPTTWTSAGQLPLAPET